jgi:hypothetical protein
MDCANADRAGFRCRPECADAHVRALRDLLQGGDSAAVNVGTGRGWSVTSYNP